MNNNNYVLVKEQFTNDVVYIDYKKKKGFKFTPLNKIKYDGIVVNKMIVIKPNFIEKVLKKKIKRQLDTYLQYIVNILDNNDDEDGSKLNIVLDQIDRYKKVVMNRYRDYLEEKYIELLLKKLGVLEKEVKLKQLYNTMQPEEKKSTRRR